MTWRGALLLMAAAALAGCASPAPTGSVLSSTATPGGSPVSGAPTTPGTSAAPGTPGPSGPPGPTKDPVVTWRRTTVGGTAAAMERVAIGTTRIVVAVDGPAGSGLRTGHLSFWSTTDTAHWLKAPDVLDGDDAVVTSITAFGSGFVAVGTDAAGTVARAWTSGDGTAWTPSAPIGSGGPGNSPAAMTSVAAGPGVALLAAGFVDLPDRRAAIAWTSHDGGLTWKPNPIDAAAASSEATTVSAGPQGWVAGGIRDATAAFWASGDGVLWARIVPEPPVGGGLGHESGVDDVACTSLACVAVGQGASDGDGLVWVGDSVGHWRTLREVDALTGGASRTVIAISRGYLAGGAAPDGRFGIWTSGDGGHWAVSDTGTGLTGIVVDLASDGTRVIAVGPPPPGGAGFSVWTGIVGP